MPVAERGDDDINGPLPGPAGRSPPNRTHDGGVTQEQHHETQPSARAAEPGEDSAAPEGRGGSPMGVDRRFFQRRKKPAGFAVPWEQTILLRNEHRRAEKRAGYKPPWESGAPAGERIISPATAV